MTLGMTRRELCVVSVLRALAIAAAASAVAMVTIVGLSPLGPLGLARRLEFDLSFRLDVAVIASTVVALATFFALVGLLSSVGAGIAQRAAANVPGARLVPVLTRMGPVAVVGATIARGRLSRVAIAVSALAGSRS